MKNKTWIRLIGVGLLSCILFSQVGCAADITVENETKEQDVVIEPMEPEESYALSFDFLGGKDVMPIGGFHGPYTAAYAPNAQPLPDFFSDEYMKAIADCGVNLIVQTPGDTSGEIGEKLLNLGEKYGVGILVHDSTINGMKGEDANPSADIIAERLSKYRNHNAFCGLYLVDEPGGKDYWNKDAGWNMEDFAKLTDVLKNDCEVDFYTNLIRIDHKNQKEQYESYLKEYCETMNPSIMCFDLYVWDTGNSKTIFFYNLALARKYALEYKIPLWNYIACGSYWDGEEVGENYNEKPLEGQFDWSINTSLAFGAQGLNYFMLIQPHYFATTSNPEVMEVEKNGLIGALGNKNRWYYYAQDISKHLSAIDGVLMNSVNKGVIVSGEQAIADTADSVDVILEGTSWRELADVKGDALVGCFNYQGKTALYVVNYDENYAQDITLKFYNNYKMQVTQDGETEYLDTSSLTLKMKAGDGALIVMQ